ncbi:MAG: SEL1-like repeat protein [Oscillibacter sp.]|nr:SEL1-like repeat protein [Oscillibacter sp.]
MSAEEARAAKDRWALLTAAIASAAETGGAEIFQDPVRLREALKGAGAAEADFCRVCLMTQAAGFWELLGTNRRTPQADLDRYLQNAVRETGFTREMVLNLTGCILSALGGAVLWGQSSGEQAPWPVMGALAAEAFARPLQALRSEIPGAFQNKGRLDVNRLEQLVNLGIPEAKYYMGLCLLKGVELEKNEERGLALLEEASEMGSAAAAAALGDYYYALGGSDHWSRAFRYYTGNGAAALNKQGKNAVAAMLNQERYNRRILVLCGGLLAVCIATVLWPPAAALYGSKPVWGWLAAAVQAALLALGVVFHRRRPYDGLYELPVAMSAVWACYMALRFLT